MYYVWVTVLLALLIAGMGAGLAFGGRLEELDVQGRSGAGAAGRERT